MPVPRPEKLSDLELLGRLKGLSWLSAAQLKELDDAMQVRSVKRNRVIFQELGKPSTEVHILLSGAAQLSHLNGDGPRIVAMMMPGVIFRLPQMPPEVGHNFEWVALERLQGRKAAACSATSGSPWASTTTPTRASPSRRQVVSAASSPAIRVSSDSPCCSAWRWR